MPIQLKYVKESNEAQSGLSLSKGIVSALAPPFIVPTASPYSLNFKWQESKLSKIAGREVWHKGQQIYPITMYGGSADTIRLITTFFTKDEVSYLVYATNNKVIYDDGSTPFIDKTPEYTAGTAQLNVSDHKTLTGTDTVWSSNVLAGNYFKFDADDESAWTKIELVNSDTEIVLAEDYKGDATSGSYTIKRTLMLTDDDVITACRAVGSINGGTPDEYLVIGTTASPIIYWNGDTGKFEWLRELSSDNPLYAEIVAFFKNHLILMNTMESGYRNNQRVWWSNVGTLDDYSTTGGTWGFTDLIETSGAIIGYGIIGDYLVIFKTDSMVLCEWVGGNDVFRFETISKYTSAVGAHAIVNTTQGLAFIGNDNIYLYLGGTNIIPLANEIKDMIFADVNMEYLSNSFAITPYEDEIWFCLPTGTSRYPTVAYVYNTTTKSWSKYEMSVSAITRYQRKVGITIDNFRVPINQAVGRFDDRPLYVGAAVILAGTTDGMVYQQEANTYALETYDNSQSPYYTESDITARFDTKEFVPDERYQTHKARWYRFEFEASGGDCDVDIYYSTDGGTTWTKYTTVNVNNEGWEWFKVDLDITSRSIMFSLRVSSKTRLEIRAIQVWYRVRSGSR